jgi:hypothetical protein
VRPFAEFHQAEPMDEAISQFPVTEVEPIASNKFPWKWVIGLMIAIPISAIGLLAGGLFLLSWAFADSFSCGEPPPAPPAKTAPKPGKSL